VNFDYILRRQVPTLQNAADFLLSKDLPILEILKLLLLGIEISSMLFFFAQRLHFTSERPSLTVVPPTVRVNWDIRHHRRLST
jgi:hypothetical protein